jgi:hypothetical protein
MFSENLNHLTRRKTMNEKKKNDEVTHVTISGDVSGRVAVGREITQADEISGQVVAVGEEITQTVGVARADLSELRQMLADLKAQVEAEAPAEKKDAALERVEELEEAVTAEEPDLTTMEYVKRWFVKHLPGLAGAVTSVIIHPIVGKLVEAAGDALAAEFRRRFGEW